MSLFQGRQIFLCQSDQSLLDVYPYALTQLLSEQPKLRVLAILSAVGLYVIYSFYGISPVFFGPFYKWEHSGFSAHRNLCEMGFTLNGKNLHLLELTFFLLLELIPIA